MEREEETDLSADMASNNFEMPPTWEDDTRIVAAKHVPFFQSQFWKLAERYDSTGRKRKRDHQITFTSMIPPKSFAVPHQLMPAALKAIQCDQARGVEFTLSETPSISKVFFELDLPSMAQAERLDMYTREIASFCQQFFASHGGITFTVSTCEPKRKKADGGFYMGAHMVGDKTVDLDDMRDIVYAVSEVLMPRLKEQDSVVDTTVVDMAVIRGSSVTLRINGAHKAIDCLFCENTKYYKDDCQLCEHRGRVLHKVPYMASYLLLPNGTRESVEPDHPCFITSQDEPLPISFPASFPRHVRSKDARRVRGEKSVHLYKGSRLASNRVSDIGDDRMSALLEFVRSSNDQHRNVGYGYEGINHNGTRISCFLKGDGSRYCPTKCDFHGSNNVSVCADKKTRKLYYNCGNPKCIQKRQVQKTFIDIPLGTFTSLFPGASPGDIAPPMRDSARRHKRRKAPMASASAAVPPKNRRLDPPERSKEAAAEFMAQLSQKYF